MKENNIIIIEQWYPNLIGYCDYSEHIKIEKNLVKVCLSLSNKIKTGGKNWISNKTYNTLNTYNILKVIGFSNDAQQSISNSLISNQIINLVGPQMLYLSIPNIIVNSYSIKNTRSNTKSIISSVPISSLQGDTQIHISTLRQGVNDKVITHLEIRITDEDDNEVNFNGVPWFLNLSFIYSYKKQYIKPNYLSDVATQDESILPSTTG
jgi:hypothetical protein